MRTSKTRIPISWRIASRRARWHAWRSRRLHERATRHADRGVMRRADAIEKRPA
jgi:hypothetical protein